MNERAQYVGFGNRMYDRYPVDSYSRAAWEIQLVIGAATPTIPAGIIDRGRMFETSLRGREHGGSPARLNTYADDRNGYTQLAVWVFRPECPHGWIAPRGTSSTVAVFHAGTVPPLLAEVVADRLWVCVSWTDFPGSAQVGSNRNLVERHIRWLLEEARELSRLGPDSRWILPVSAGFNARNNVAIGVATSLIIAGLPAGELLGHSRDETDAAMMRSAIFPTPSGESHGRATLNRAIAWYESVMHTAPRVVDVSRAVGTSAGNLNRLSRRLHRVSIGELLLRCRMARARRLLGGASTYDGDDLRPIGEIAAACGYTDQSAFSRAVHTRLGCSPSCLRKSVRETNTSTVVRDDRTGPTLPDPV